MWNLCFGVSNDPKCELVGGFNPSEKYESSWDDYSQCKNKKWQPNHQPVKGFCAFATYDFPRHPAHSTTTLLVLFSYSLYPNPSRSFCVLSCPHQLRGFQPALNVGQRGIRTCCDVPKRISSASGAPKRSNLKCCLAHTSAWIELFDDRYIRMIFSLTSAGKDDTPINLNYHPCLFVVQCLYIPSGWYHGAPQLCLLHKVISYNPP